MAGKFGRDPGREDSLSLEGPHTTPTQPLPRLPSDPLGLYPASAPRWVMIKPSFFLLKSELALCRLRISGCIPLLPGVCPYYRQPVFKHCLLRKLAFPWHFLQWPVDEMYTIYFRTPSDPLIYTSYPYANSAGVFTLAVLPDTKVCLETH